MHFARPTVCLQKCILLVFVLFITSGCIYNFANRERMGPTQPKTLYLSPVKDFTARSTQSGKLMAALRRLLTQDRQFILTDLKTARWGVDIQIIEGGRAITRVEKCDQGNEILASGAVPCGKVAASGKLPDVSAEEEVAQLSVDARAIDLQSGAVLFQIRLQNLNSGAYNIVGDGTVRASLSNSQDLHVLRYMENSENAIESIAATAAARIYEQLVSIPPPSPSL